jgi:hypothetical protein
MDRPSARDTRPALTTAQGTKAMAEAIIEHTHKRRSILARLATATVMAAAPVAVATAAELLITQDKKLDVFNG